MKHTFIAALLALGLPATALAAAKLPFPDVPATQKEASAKGKPQLIIWYGSDWMPKGDQLCAEWNKLAGMDLPVVLGQYDDHLGQEGDARNKVLPIEHYNLPAAVLLDEDGNFMAVFEGKTVRDAGKLADAVRKLAPHAKEFTKFVNLAKSGSGLKAAVAAGRALDLLPMERGALRMKLLRNIINKEDAADKSGYRSLYAMDHLAMFKEIEILLKGGADGKLTGDQRDFAAAEAYIRKTLANTKLQGERRQQWLAGLYYVQKERGTAQGKRDLKPALATLKEITAISPKTYTGRGAARYYNYWDDTAAYTVTGGFYDASLHTLRFEKEWHVDVTDSVDGPGEYTFSLVQRKPGPVATRDFRLVINGKEVVKPTNADPQKDTKSVDFTVPEFPAGSKVEVWLRAKNNSIWLDGTGLLQMKKK